MNRPHLRYTWISRLFLAAATTAMVACGAESTGGTASTADATDDAAALTDAGADATAGNDTTAGADAAKDIAKKDIQAPPDNDKTIDGALALEFGVAGSDTLDPVGDVDYWKFEGKKGQVIAIYIEAQSQTTAFDPDTLDTIITVYGPDKQQLAFNDDPSSRTNNDSYLNLKLPADGSYYVRVEECWTWLGAHPQKAGVSCADPQEKGNVDYNINVVEWDPATMGLNIESADANETAETAQTLPITKGQTGKYQGAALVGTFSGVVDIDVYHFTIPADAASQITSGRPTIQADMDKLGVDGDGSTALMGNVWLASDTTPTVKLSQADFAKVDTISAPGPFGAGYFLFVSRVGGSPALTANEYYWFGVGFGGSNPLETAEVTNNDAAGAETTKQEQTTSGNPGFYFEGDLISNATDTDWWQIAVPKGFEGGKFYLFCGAESSGSGLRGFKAELFSDPKTPVAGGTATEAADGLKFGDTGIAVPAAGGTFYVKISAASQAADVTSSFYRCGSIFEAP